MQTKVIVIKEKMKKKMLSFKQAITKEKDKREFKDRILESIMNEVNEYTWANKVVKIRWDRAKKLVRVLDEMLFKAADRGFSFNGRETLAELCECDVTTVDKAIKVLKESGQAVFCYGINPKTNGFKTPILFLKEHEYFAYWRTYLGMENTVESKVEKKEEISEKSSYTKDRSQNLDDTYLTLTSEINTLISNINNEENYFSVFNILEDINLSKNQTFAKKMIMNCPFIAKNIRENARKIAIKLPSSFSELDFGTLANTIRNLQGRTPLKPVSYFLKAFYKNKIHEAKTRNLPIENEQIPAELLPQKFKDYQRLQKLRLDLVNYQKQGNNAMFEAVKMQIQIMVERMSKNKCII